jgi:hypothetical protein
MFISRSRGATHQVCVIGPPDDDELEAFQSLLDSIPVGSAMAVRIEDDIVAPEDVALYLTAIERALRRGLRITCQRAANVQCHLCSAAALCDPGSIWELQQTESPRRIRPGPVRAV